MNWLNNIRRTLYPHRVMIVPKKIEKLEYDLFAKYRQLTSRYSHMRNARRYKKILLRIKESMESITEQELDYEDPVSQAPDDILGETKVADAILTYLKRNGIWNVRK